MTYNSLVAQISAYLDRTDAPFLAQIPNFISQAEQRICRESKNIGLEQYITGNLIASNSVISKPARWRRSLSFFIDIGATLTPPVPSQAQILFLRSYDFLRTYWPDDTAVSMPKFYADYGYDNWLVAPTPDSAYPYQISYLELPEPITLLNQTNWITNNAPDVLLYATLLEATPYLKADERIQVWQAFYDKGMASLNAQDDQRTLDRASNRSAD